MMNWPYIKELESSQTDKMIEKFPQFNDYGQNSQVI